MALRSTTPKMTTASTHSSRKIVTIAETSRMSTSGSVNCMAKRRSGPGPLGGVSWLRPNWARRCSTAKRSRPSAASVSRRSTTSGWGSACQC